MWLWELDRKTPVTWSAPQLPKAVHWPHLPSYPHLIRDPIPTGLLHPHERLISEVATK